MSAGIVPVILLLLRYLRRRGAVARRAGRRGRGGNSQAQQPRELAEPDRDRAGDLVVVEDPATPRNGRARRAGRRGRGGNSQVRQRSELKELGRDLADLKSVGVPATPGFGRAPRRASGTRRELVGQLFCRRGIVALAKHRDRGRTRSALPEIAAAAPRAARRDVRAARRDQGVAVFDGASLDVAEGGRERAGDRIVAAPGAVESPATPRDGRAARRASGTRGELAVASAP